MTPLVRNSLPVYLTAGRKTELSTPAGWDARRCGFLVKNQPSPWNISRGQL